jgi:DNA-binding IclR family transcriptional regulator
MEFPLLVERVQSEFNEMPGLRLTPAQAARLLGLPPRTCQKVIQTLVRAEFLRWTDDGSIVRADADQRSARS